MQIKSDLNIYNRAIGSQSKISGLIKAEIDPDSGEIVFKSLFDGFFSTEIEKTSAHVETLGINDLRVFDSSGQATLGTRQGLTQVADEARVINERLRNASPATQDLLNRLGLGDLLNPGSDVSLTYAHFKHSGKVQKLKNLLDNDLVQKAGVFNLTDSGVTTINYSVGDTRLTAAQAKDLQYALGVGKLTPSFTQKVIGGDDSGFGKLPKRLQGLLSARDISIGGSSLADLKSKTYVYDDVELFFKSIFNPGDVSDIDRYLMSAGLDMTEGQRLRLMNASVGDGKGGGKLLVKYRTSLMDQLEQISPGLSRSNILNELRRMYDAGGGSLDGLKDNIKNILDHDTFYDGSTATPDQKDFARTMRAAIEDVEKMRDGEFVGTTRFINEQKKELIRQKEDLISRPGLKTEEDLLEIKKVQKQIDGLESMLKKKLGGSKAKSTIARIFFPEGSFAGGLLDIAGGLKGEMAIIANNLLPTQLRGFNLIAPKSAFKKEVASSEALVQFNVAKKTKGIVYTDPLMIAYDSKYMNSPEFREALDQNVNKQIAAIQDFQRTGVLPEEARKAIFEAIDQDLIDGLSDDAPVKNLGVKLGDLTPGARSAVLRNRQEAETIRQLMASGVDPRNIPALLRRINEYFSTQAFRMKGDRVDLAMPDARRSSIRTYSSELARGKDIAQHEEVMVKVSQNLANAPDAVKASMGIDASGAGKANFVQFQLDGSRMKISGPNAALYHHALGTFDLDDSVVDNVVSFRDASGSDRMGFMVGRQPTGLQEKIFMQADLTHNNTLKTILEKSSGDFRSLMNDPSAIYSLSASERQVLADVQKVLDGDKKINLRKLGHSSADVEKVLIKLRKTHGQNHGFTTLMKIAQEDLDEMVATKSSSALGLDKVMAQLSGGSMSHTDFMADFGMQPNAAPMYSKGNFQNLITEAGEREDDGKLVQIFNDRMADQPGYVNVNTRAEIEALASSDPLAKVRMDAAVDLVSDLGKKANLPSVENTIGLYINRQAASVAMSDQVDAILDKQLAGELIDYIKPDGTSIKMPLKDYVKIQYSSALIPPSNAVDAVTDSSPLLLRADEMRERMRQLDVINIAERQFAGGIASALDDGVKVSEEAVTTILKDLGTRLGVDQAGNGLVTLGDAGKHTIDQSNKGLGFVRAMQIAVQIRDTGVVDEGSLAGYDPVLISGETYGRVAKQDSDRMVKDFIEQMKEARDLVADPSQKAAIQSSIDELEGMTFEDKIERIRLKEGTAAYQEYSGTASLKGQAGRAKDAIDGQSALGQKQARLATDILAPTRRAQYMDSVDQLINSQIDGLENIKHLADGDTLDASTQTLKAFETIKVNASFYQGLSAIAHQTPGANILDINDTLEAGLTSRYGRTIARSILSSETAIDGSETAMRDIQTRSRQQRVSKYNLQTADKDAAESVQQRFNRIRGGRTDVSLAEISQNEARAYLDYVDSYEKKNKFLPNTFDNDVYDFMRYTAGGTEDLLGAQGDAFEAYRYFGAQNNLNTLADEFSTGAIDNLLMPDSDIDDVTRRIVADDPSSVNMGSRASNGAYTRVQDFMDSPALRQVYENPTIRRGAMGLAALAVFGFVYSARKDRTSDEMSGPPLLPGGSAYESDMPKYVPSLSNLKYLNPVVAGMQYKINVNGSQKDIEKMQSLTEGVVDGPVNSTMYNSLPRLGSDPYQNVASRF
jgi:hypothetical protein